MRTTTSLIHIAALAIAAAGLLGAPKPAAAQTETYSTRPCRIVEGISGCAPDGAATYSTKPCQIVAGQSGCASSSSNSKLPSAVIAAKRTVEARGVSQPNLKPSICNVRPDMFKGCQVF